MPSSEQPLPALPALAGTRVVEFAQVAAGPYLCSLLGDLGADVIKVEPPGGDSLRRVDEAFGAGASSYFFGANRSKRAIALDVRAPEAREIVEGLVAAADVIVLSMRPSAVARARLDYATLSTLNPRLVYVSITGFGETGPRAEEPGMDILAQALSGVMGLTGEPGQAPVRVGPAVADISTSFLGGFAVCAALLARERDGVGQQICLNLLDSAISLLPNYATQYLRTREPIPPAGGAHPQIVPYQVFATADGYVIVACLSDRFWPPLCAALQRPDWAEDPDYRTNVQRVRNRAALIADMTPIMAARPTSYWIAQLGPHDVPCSRVHPIQEVFDDPQVVSNGTAFTLQHPRIGQYRVVNNPIRMSRTPPTPHGYAPRLGEHTAEILAELGYSPAEVKSLIDRRLAYGTGSAS